MSVKYTEEDIPFLNSAAAVKLRKHISSQMKGSNEALIHAALESTDPKVRGIATSYLTWKAAYKELEYNEPE